MDERVQREADLKMADTAQPHPADLQDSAWSRITAKVEQNVPRLREIATHVALMGPIIATLHDDFWGGVRGGC
jgi:hypothetical protein